MEVKKIDEKRVNRINNKNKIKFDVFYSKFPI